MPDLLPAQQPQMNRGFLIQISLIAALGGLLYGFDMGIIAASIIFVRHTFSLSTMMEEVVVSVVLVGAMVGAIAGGLSPTRLAAARRWYGRLSFLLSARYSQPYRQMWEYFSRPAR